MSCLQRRRWLGAGLVAGGGVGLLLLMSAMHAAFAFGDDTALVMGGTAMPTPTPSYLDNIADLYLDCGDDCASQGVFTPEALYPATGTHSLTLDTSADQGVSALDAAVKTQLADGNDGDELTVFGYSQSATVASMEMHDILNGAAGIQPEPDELRFVLLGDPSNPNGGLLERLNFPDDSHPSIPSLGITFSGATPETEYDTDVYTGEYDLFGDFPRYPLNLLADLNALLGYVFVHSQYPDFSAEQVGDKVEVPTSDGYDGATTYYMLPTEDLPLLDPVRAIPGAGPVVADLLEPNLRTLVNLGYGDPEYGWVNEDADVPTTLGVSPGLDDLAKVPGMLIDGTEHGIRDALEDLQDPAKLLASDDNPLTGVLENSYLQDVASELLTVPTSPGDESAIVDALAAATSDMYSILLPTADIATAITTTLPAYDADVFLDELAGGDLLGAIGFPAAVDTGILPIAAGLELIGVAEGVAQTGIDLASPFVDVADLLP